MSDWRDRADLRCTRLCDIGPDHQDPDCPYAHKLSELRAPDESRQSYRLIWDSFCVDRFYGQAVSDDQLQRIKFYYDATPSCDLPLWARALALICSHRERENGFAYPWDFGLLSDYWTIRVRRPYGGQLFAGFDGLWGRLLVRRESMLSYVHPPHMLGMESVDLVSRAMSCTWSVARLPAVVECVPSPIHAAAESSIGVRVEEPEPDGDRRRGRRGGRTSSICCVHGGSDQQSVFADAYSASSSEPAYLSVSDWLFEPVPWNGCGL